MWNSPILGALTSAMRREPAGAGRQRPMRAPRPNRRHAAALARPDWLPHPVLMQLIAALWLAVAALRLLEGLHL